MDPGNKVEVAHGRDRRKQSPDVSASIGGDQFRRDRRIKSPGVSLALAPCGKLLGISESRTQISVDLVTFLPPDHGRSAYEINKKDRGAV